MSKLKSIPITIGIAAYNEEANIRSLLESIKNQKLKLIRISEILVISSGSTDKTNEIVKKLTFRNKKIQLIKQLKRLGKASAVNLILAKAKEEIVVLMSADILLAENTLEKLVSPMSNRNIGIVGSRPIPLNDKETFFGFASHLLWDLHHKISLKTPKMGECIAFRKVFKQIPVLSSVDEANIEPLIRGQGFKTVYQSQAKVYNMGAQNLNDFINRRRHIYAGHLATMHEYSYKVSTINGTKILLELIKDFKFTWQFIIYTPLVILLEIYSRFLGLIDYKFKKKSHTIWQVTKSTKALPLQSLQKSRSRTQSTISISN